MLDLLFFFTQLDESAGDLLNYVCMGVVILAVAILIILCRLNKKFDSKELAFAGVCLSASFVLSFIKIAPVQYGGSITLASMLPVMIYAYFYGFSHGLLAGIIYGLLQFIQSPYILTPATFALDYIFAFASISLMCVAKTLKPKIGGALAITAGASCVYLFRFIMHFLSGMIYFDLGSVWTNLPASSGAIYSLLYQIVYLVPDYLITLIAFLLLEKNKVINRLRSPAQQEN